MRIMKWLSAGAGRPEAFFLPSKNIQLTTDDSDFTTQLPDNQQYISNQPLPPLPFTTYSVTRINPIFIEDGGKIAGEKISVTGLEQSCCKDHSLHTSPLREDSLKVLEQNSHFVKSISISTGSERCNKVVDTEQLPKIKKEQCRPTWPTDKPKNGSKSRYNESSLHDNYKSNKPVAKYDFEMQNENYKSVPEVLRELSNSINAAIDNMGHIDTPPEYVVRSLRDDINKTLEALSTSENALSGNNVATDNVVATLSRAFSFVNAFKGSSRHTNEADDVETGRLMLLKRLGRLAPYDPYYDHLQKSSSNSSTASTSGFSDLTHTPASSTSSPSESPSASRTVGNLEAQKAVFIKNNHYNNNNNINNRNDSGNNSSSGESSLQNDNDNNRLVVRSNGNSKPNIITFGTLQYQIIQTDSAKSSPNLQDCRVSLFDPRHSFPPVKLSPLEHGKELVAKAETLLSSYPGHRCPDFTLDVHQSERLMKKIEAGKKERCWCRVATSFIGFVFLLFSVMFFSMMLTRGEKMFGSI